MATINVKLNSFYEKSCRVVKKKKDTANKWTGGIIQTPGDYYRHMPTHNKLWRKVNF